MIKQEIAKYIEEKGIKQVFISQKIGIPPQSVGLILRGERNLDVEEYLHTLSIKYLSKTYGI